MTDREKDAAIAERFFGWRWWTRNGYRWFGPANAPDIVKAKRYLGDPSTFLCDESQFDDKIAEDPWWLDCPEDEERLPHYCTNPAASKQLREKLAEKYSVLIMRTTNGRTTVEVWNEIPQDFAPTKLVDHSFGKGDTLEEAIVECALKTK